MDVGYSLLGAYIYAWRLNSNNGYYMFNMGYAKWFIIPSIILLTTLQCL